MRHKRKHSNRKKVRHTFTLDPQNVKVVRQAKRNLSEWVDKKFQDEASRINRKP